MTYKLYAATATEENINLAEEHRYSYVTDTYVLVYSDKKFRCGKELKGDALDWFNREEAKWLFNCIMEVTAEWARKNEEAMANQSGEFLNNFEKELRAEKRKLEQEG